MLLRPALVTITKEFFSTPPMLWYCPKRLELLKPVYCSRI